MTSASDNQSLPGPQRKTPRLLAIRRHGNRHGLSDGGARFHWFSVPALLGAMAVASATHAQVRPYVGFAYPAGGQQGTTFPVKLGGQGLDDVAGVRVTGPGVSARVVEYHRRLNPQDMTLLSEQLRDLRKSKGSGDQMMAPMMSSADPMMSSGAGPRGAKTGPQAELIERIQRRMAAYVQRPASNSIANLVFVEVTIARDAEPGERELRLVTPRGVSNPLVFHVGQVNEYTRKPMLTSHFQVLGKESLALRKRPPEEVEVRVALPCTVNGQVASGEVNQYRFEARKGQRLVISTEARKLIPYIADAVPGWFQPVLSLHDAKGKEVAFNDDYRFKPDPVILFEVPKTGEYVLSMNDAIFRGREDFVYRVTIGEVPFVTSIFPLGGRAGELPTVEMKGWNLQNAVLALPPKGKGPGVYPIVARKAGVISNPMPFAIDALPEIVEQEPNNDRPRAQKVTLPVMINGRIDRRDDWDVFEVSGRAGDTIVAEVYARRLESPLDSVLTLTDASRNILAMNDDREDVEAGVNTHDADSYIMFKLPADGKYCVHVGDTARCGGEEYAYRLRISAPQPDFALRVVPSSLGTRSRSSGPLSVYVVRKDGFAGPIKLRVKEPSKGFSVYPNSLTGNQPIARISVNTELKETKQAVSLVIEGLAQVRGREIVHEAVAAEDRMQAFLWRHLVPAEDLAMLVFDPSRESGPKRVARATPAKKATGSAVIDPTTGKAKFTKQQVAGRIRQIKSLYEEGLLTDEFNNEKLAECEAAQ